jgi:hypothetical protein
MPANAADDHVIDINEYLQSVNDHIKQHHKLVNDFYDIVNYDLQHHDDDGAGDDDDRPIDHAVRPQRVPGVPARGTGHLDHLREPS